MAIQALSPIFGAVAGVHHASRVMVWRIDGDPGYVFRAKQIVSLHRPGVGSPR